MEATAKERDVDLSCLGRVVLSITRCERERYQQRNRDKRHERQRKKNYCKNYCKDCKCTKDLCRGISSGCANQKHSRW